jgi:hypothetical protein
MFRVWIYLRLKCEQIKILLSLFKVLTGQLSLILLSDNSGQMPTSRGQTTAYNL